MVVDLSFLLIVVCQNKRTACTEYEESGGVTGWEGIAMMHVYALHQWQHHVIVMFEGTDRTLKTERVFQYLQQRAPRQFAQREEDCHLYLLPE